MPTLMENIFALPSTSGGNEENFVYTCEDLEIELITSNDIDLDDPKILKTDSLNCKFCVYHANNSKNMKNHLKKHFNVKKHICETCGFTAGSRNDLRRHSLIHTLPNERPYICYYCGKGYVSKAAIIIHIRIHTGDRPFKCELCDYSTVRNGDLTSHMKRHSDEKPYICDCGFKTNRFPHLKRHLERRHKYSGHPFKCKFCTRAYPTMDERDMHEVTHKRVSCPFCNYTSSSRRGLDRHVNKIHLKGMTEVTNCPCCDFVSSFSAVMTRHIIDLHSSSS